LLLVVCSAVAAAQPQPGADDGTQLREDLLRSYRRAANRLVRLAEAMPADRFAWRPAEGVRSFSEVLMHVAEGNYHFARSLGVPGATAPEPGELVAVVAKDEVLAKLRESNELAAQAIAGIEPASFDQEAELFGMRQSRRALALLVAEHAHEHVGQAIAYARMNGVTPPWSQ
jgi:uncharacterized damage-inducible protein DinB